MNLDWLWGHWPFRRCARITPRVELEAMKEKVERADQVLAATEGALQEAKRATDKAFVRLETRTSVVKQRIGQEHPYGDTRDFSGLTVLRRAIRRAGDLPLEQGLQDIGETMGGRKGR